MEFVLKEHPVGMITGVEPLTRNLFEQIHCLEKRETDYNEIIQRAVKVGFS